MSRGQGAPLAAMVQPSGSLGGDSELIGGEGLLGSRPGGTLHMPCSQTADLGGVQPLLQYNRELQRENGNLREAIRQSNQALKDRCDELQDFRTKNREEKEFLAGKFQEARCAVEQLRAANRELRRQAVGASEDAKGARAGLEPAVERGPSGSTWSSLASYTTITQSMFSSTAAPEEEDPSPQGTDGAQVEGTEYLRLLKARKEELEDDLRVLQAENQQLRLKLSEAGTAALAQDRSEDRQREAVQGAGGQSAVSSSPAVTQTEDEMSKLKIAESKLCELQNRLAQAQGRAAQFEQSEGRLRRQEAELQEHKAAGEQQLQTLGKQLEQLTEDRASLKAQVTSLLGELQDSQSSLEVMTKENSTLERKCRTAEERLRAQEQEAEGQKKQYSVTVDQLRIAVHNFESALKTERMSASEDKRKLAQLQAAYHHLFEDYDRMVKSLDDKQSRGQMEEVMQQLREAEDALVMKQDLIDKLKEDAEKRKAELETIPVLNAQAEVFKADFLAERSAREKLHEQKEVQHERLLALQAEFEKLRTEHEEATRAHIEEMQRRHNDSLRGPMGGQGNYFQSGNTIPFNAAAEPARRRSVPDEQPDFRCPKCQYLAPDMDTLQIHVMDCIQ